MRIEFIFKIRLFSSLDRGIRHPTDLELQKTSLECEKSWNTG